MVSVVVECDCWFRAGQQARPGLLRLCRRPGHQNWPGGRSSKLASTSGPSWPPRAMTSSGLMTAAILPSVLGFCITAAAVAAAAAAASSCCGVVPAPLLATVTWRDWEVVCVCVCVCMFFGGGWAKAEA